MIIKIIANLLAVSLLLSVAVVAEEVSAATGSTSESRRTTMLGTRSEQFYLSKITVSDLKKSYDFYTGVVGLKWAVAPGTSPVTSQLENAGEKTFVEIPLNFSGSLADPIFVLVKMRDVTPSPDLTKLIWVGFKVPSAREAVARAAQAGYPSTGREPGEGPMAFGFIRDPDGYNVEFVQAPSYPDR